MVVYVPFGDNQAHGALGKTLIFARRRGKVYIKRYRSPKNPNSTDQQIQRTKFQDAVQAWGYLPESAKTWWRVRATGQSPTGYNLFVQAYLLGKIPPNAPFVAQRVTHLNVNNIRQVWPYGCTYRVQYYPSGLIIGITHDYRNYYTEAPRLGSAYAIRLYIHNQQRNVNTVAGDTLTAKYDLHIPLTIYLPEMHTSTYLYISTDGSTYYDPALTMLAQGPP